LLIGVAAIYNSTAALPSYQTEIPDVQVQLDSNRIARVAYGKYLMTDAMECANCHSASFETYNIVNPEQSEGYLSGGNLVELPGLGKLLSPNITMPPEKGIGKMTVEEFIQTVKYRQHRTGRELNPIMPSYNS